MSNDVNIAKDLKIGNWVRYEGTIQKEIVMGSGDIHDLASGEMAELGIEILPLQITEDWLRRFGFKKYRDIIWMVRYPHSVIFEIAERGNDHFGLWTGSGIMGNIQFVHQLQNLYSALTQQELILISTTLNVTPS